MQVLILAAGMGKRLSDLTQDVTKCMVKVNGVSLIDRALKQISEFTINRIVIVIGYKGEVLKNHLGTDYNGIPIIYVTNPIYFKTNNIYSLFLAKNIFAEDDTLLIESDLIFNKSVLYKAMNCHVSDNIVVVDKYQSWMDGTVVELNAENEIKYFVSKNEFEFDRISNYYKTVNIYRFSKDFINHHYIPFLEAYCKSVGNNEYYENVLKVLTFLDSTKLKVCILNKTDKWYEIDDKQDLNNAETIFSDDITKYQFRYGGYWRFPYLKDFCYLVNPYFPPKRMIDEYKTYFETLLHDYPSTLNIQNLLAAKIFNCDQNYITVGNGAAELINALMSGLENERIGVITPTFHEYIARSPIKFLKKFSPVNDDFAYNIDDLIKFSDEIDVLVLINPDNPSGNYIKKDILIQLLSYFKEKGKKLILDESFVDFTTDTYLNSLIDNEILSKFKNLIIIKSISKSYGVPGIRLGIIATANSLILDKIRQKLSVWNINSFGEFFLQVFGKYEEIYKDACTKIANERDRLFNDLKTISYLRPINSQANYFLCEVKKMSATELTQLMMKDYNILLKDCTGKTGFQNKEFVRIAVRDFNDNQFLISALKEIDND